VTGIDHIISDRVASPPEIQIIYAEKKIGTLGAATGIDHIISDRVASPPEYQLIYAEKLLLLQTPYLPNDYVATVAEPELARKLLPQDDAVCVCVCVFVRVCVCVCA